MLRLQNKHNTNMLRNDKVKIKHEYKEIQGFQNKRIAKVQQ